MSGYVAIGQELCISEPKYVPTVNASTSQGFDPEKIIDVW
jgi:hypothetical protein